MNSRENPSSLLLLRLKPWFSKNRNLSLWSKAIGNPSNGKVQNEPSDCAKEMERGELFISTVVPRGSRIGFHVYNLTGSGAFHMPDLEKGAREGVSVWEWPSFREYGGYFIAGFRKCHLDFPEISKCTLSSRS